MSHILCSLFIFQPWWPMTSSSRDDCEPRRLHGLDRTHRPCHGALRAQRQVLRASKGIAALIFNSIQFFHLPRCCMMHARYYFFSSAASSLWSWWGLPKSRVCGCSWSTWSRRYRSVRCVWVMTTTGRSYIFTVRTSPNTHQNTYIHVAYICSSC